VAVETAEVARSTVRDVGLFSGSLQPRARFVVAPKVGGRLEKLYVDVGDVVYSGQPIATLDGQEYAQQVDQARAALAVAEANLEDARIALEAARREMKRASELRDKKIASASEFDTASDQLSQAQARHELVQAQVRQQQVALELAQARLSDARIMADWEESSGSRVIGERFVDVGALLKANDPIVSVLDIGSLQAAIQIPEQSYGRIRTGQSAVVTTDILPGRRFSGRVVRMAPFLQENSRQAEVWIEVPNPDGSLKPGMFVKVELEFARRENVVTIPSSALVRNEDRQGVFLVDTEAGKARFVPVTTGITDGDRVEVLDPPLSGLVVTLGQHLLQDGSSILQPRATQRPASQPQSSTQGAAP
jgi:RND family efflux transporter MFP subunit